MASALNAVAMVTVHLVSQTLNNSVAVPAQAALVDGSTPWLC